jgi:excinuclease ABC subunit C
LLYQIGRCAGPCVGIISKDAYAQNVQLAILFLEGKSSAVVEALQARMETASQALNFELAAHYRNQISRLRQIQERQYVDVADGNADIIGMASQGGMICLQVLSIRDGQLLGSRAYFPSVPAHSDMNEIVSAFITQYYIDLAAHQANMPKQLIVGVALSDRALIENVLSEQAQRKIAIIHPERGEKKKWLDMAALGAKQSLTAHLFSKTNMQERAVALQNVVGLKKMPHRIECFDISHTMGEATVASCVVFDAQGPVKSDYRHFNITDITPGDDVAAMRQVLLRRFKRLKRDEVALPDIVLIDGGPTQLAAAKAVKDELNIPQLLLVGVSKGPGRKPGYESLHFSDQPPIHLPSDSLALHFIQQIRDEAHRFAITGHRQRRDKARRQSSLEFIPGVGPKRRRDLLRYFGGIQGIAHASLEELMKVPGINKSLAERLFAAFHDTTI